LARSADFFSFLGLPRKLNLDMADFEQRYRALSRQFHPDYFYNAPAAERRGALEKSSYLNDAYRTLKSPIARIEYLLKLEGFEQSAGGGRQSGPPQSLLEEVFALNEELDEVREQKAVEPLEVALELKQPPPRASRPHGGGRDLSSDVPPMRLPRHPCR